MDRATRRLILLTVVAGSLLVSCTIMERVRHLSPGEVRLTRLNAPERVEEGVGYQASLIYQSSTTPLIRQVCCRWIAENPTIKNASMYWYNLEVASNMDPGTAGTKWVDKGPIQDFSSTFCFADHQLRLVGGDTIVFHFTAREIKPTYNRLECYAETMVDGAFRESNRVGASVNRVD